MEIVYSTFDIPETINQHEINKQKTGITSQNNGSFDKHAFNELVLKYCGLNEEEDDDTDKDAEKK